MLISTHYLLLSTHYLLLTTLIGCRLLLAVRLALPNEGAKAQLEAALEACGGEWPTFDTPDGGVGVTDDVSCGAELGRPEVIRSDRSPPLPPFVYVRECIAFDVTPSWSAVGRGAGCKCTVTRNRTRLLLIL